MLFRSEDEQCQIQLSRPPASLPAIGQVRCSWASSHTWGGEEEGLPASEYPPYGICATPPGHSPPSPAHDPIGGSTARMDVELRSSTETCKRVQRKLQLCPGLSNKHR